MKRRLSARLLALLVVVAGAALGQEVKIGDAVRVEGNGGVVMAMFDVTVSFPTVPLLQQQQPYVIDYATRDGSATAADADYVAVTKGQLTFTAVGTETIFIEVNGDTKVEADETFFVDIRSSDPDLIFTDSEGMGTILNDDATALSITDVSVAEGNAGMVKATFDVTLSAASDFTVTADFASRDGTATIADGDYQAAAGGLSFAPGETAKTVTVTVNGDLVVEADEVFFVDLSKPVGAGIADATGDGTIRNDDATSLSIGDAGVAEGDSGGVDLVFPVTLSAPSAATVTVAFATRDGTATVADDDYRARNGRLTFAPGETEKRLPVAVVGDRRLEPDEQLEVVLSRPRGAGLGDALGVGTIRNDDAAAGVVRLVDAPAVAESAGSAVVTVERSGGAGGPASVEFATGDGSATAGEDYGSAIGTLSWAAGESGAKTFTVAITDDNLSEGDETVVVRLANPTGAALGSPDRLDLVILDDDVPSRLEAVGDTERPATVNGALDLEVRATRDDGTPVQGASVLWTVEGDAELLDGPQTSTDTEGLASNRVRLGTSLGRVIIRARIAGTDETVVFEILVEGDLDELFDPSREPGQSSVASALNDGCFDPAPGFEELCDYLFSLDRDDQRTLINELTPSEAGALGDISLRSPYVQLLNLREHLAARRRGGRSGAGNQLALSLGGQNLPVALLLSSFSGYGDSERLFVARIDAALFQQEEEPAPAAAVEIDAASRWSFFLSGRVEIGDRPETGNEQGFDLETLGVTAGVDYRVTPRFIVGGALGLVDTQTELAGGGGGLDVRGYSVSAFTTYFRDRVWLDGIVTYSTIDYEALRHIDLPQPFQGRSRFSARGQPDGQQLAIDWGVGYDTSLGAASLGSFGRLSYIDAEVDPFIERGAGPFNLAMRGQEIESLLAEAGIEVVWAASREWGVLQPLLRASVLHEFEDDGRSVVASFAADARANELRIPTDRPDRDFFKVAAGLTATLARGRAVYLLYETDLERDDLDLYSLAAGLRLEF